MDAQAIQKQQVELQNAIRLGDEVQKHTALREEDRTKIRMHVSSLKNQWQSLEERMHKKVKRYMHNSPLKMHPAYCIRVSLSHIL
jgi:uncharacterized protein YllA (UPF0747 family)